MHTCRHRSSDKAIQQYIVLSSYNIPGSFFSVQLAFTYAGSLRCDCGFRMTSFASWHPACNWLRWLVDHMRLGIDCVFEQVKVGEIAKNSQLKSCWVQEREQEANRPKKRSDIPIPMVRVLPSYERDYLPVFRAGHTYIRGRGEPML